MKRLCKVNRFRNFPGVSKKIPQHEDFTEQLNQDKINFYNKWTHAKTKLGAPLLFSELSEDEATNIEGVKMFFANDPEEERRYIFLRDEFAKTLNGTDRENYITFWKKGLPKKRLQSDSDTKPTAQSAKE